MRNKYTVLMGFALSLSTGLMGCQNNLPPAQTSAGLRPAQQNTAAPAAAPELSPKPAESNPLQAELQRDGNHDRLTFSLGQGFKTQALDTSTLQYMRIWVTGPGIASPIYATSTDPDNFINIAGSIPPVSIGSIPRGNYRVITAQFYDIARNPVAVAYAKAVYSSTESGGVSIEVNRRSIPLAEVISQITTARPDLLDKLDFEELKTILNNVMNWNGTSFGVDPSRFVTTALASLLINLGQIPSNLQVSLTPGSDYIKETASYSFNVSGLVGNDKVIIRLADPTSPLITQGNGPVNITGILPGTWPLSISTQAGITYTSGLIASENVTFTAGDALNRAAVVLDHANPVIHELSISRGPRNSEFEIIGENFHTTAATNVVNFNQGGSDFTAEVLEAQSDRLRVKVPNVTDPGDYNVTVQVGARTSGAQVYNVQKIWYIKPDGDVAAQGDSWANATTLQRALADAGAGDQLWLQRGTYLPGIEDPHASFVINKAVTLLGGFAGTESNAEQRDPKTNLTILSGDQVQNDDPTDISIESASRQDNSYHVVTIADVPDLGGWDDPVATLDGLVIEGGNARVDGDRPVAPGGGFDFGPPECDEFHPDFPDCEDTGGDTEPNRDNQGGGVLALSPVEIYNTHFRRNTAFYAGALLYAGSGRMRLYDNHFSQNTAGENGGALYLLSGADVKRNHFENNAAYNGGAVHVPSGGESGRPDFYNNVFIQNTASRSGGAVYSSAQYMEFQRNLLFGNSAGDAGGGLQHNLTGGWFEHHDNLYLQNQARQGGGAYIAAYSGWGTPTHTSDNNSYIQNTATEGGSGLYWMGGYILNARNTLFMGNDLMRGSNISILLEHNATDLASLAALVKDDTTSFAASVTDGNDNSLFNVSPQFQNSLNPIGPDGLWKTDDDGLIPLLSSPLAGAGVYRGATWHVDIRGRHRTSNAADYPDFSEDPTIGAYEHNGKPPAPPDNWM